MAVITVGITHALRSLAHSPIAFDYMVPTADDFRNELKAQLAHAEKRAGATYLDVNAGELHRTVGGYPGPDHRMPTCCNVMHQEMQAGDELLIEPNKGKGASFTVRYKFPRTAKVVPLRRPSA